MRNSVVERIEGEDKVKSKRGVGSKIGLALIFVLWGARATAAGAEHRCGAEQIGTFNVRWCLDQGNAQNPNVLYYLHGGEGSEQSWVKNTDKALLREEFVRQQQPLPSVISISFGPAWLMSELSGHHQAFLKVMKRLEAKLKHVEKRFLMGESMGGFNAAMLLLKNGNLFDRVVLMCPSLASISPHSSYAEQIAFLKKYKAYVNYDLVSGVLAWALTLFPEPTDWQQHDPSVLVERLSDRSPRLHISCGEQDEYGFFEGAERFARKAQKQGVLVHWEPLAGGHCVSNPASIARFLSSP